MERTERVKKLLAFLKGRFPEGIQVFDTRNISGDAMENIYDDDGITVDYACFWMYIEIFGLTKDEFKSIGEFDSLNVCRWVD